MGQGTMNTDNGVTKALMFVAAMGLSAASMVWIIPAMLTGIESIRTANAVEKKRSIYMEARLQDMKEIEVREDTFIARVKRLKEIESSFEKAIPDWQPYYGAAEVCQEVQILKCNVANCKIMESRKEGNKLFLVVEITMSGTAKEIDGCLDAVEISERIVWLDEIAIWHGDAEGADEKKLFALGKLRLLYRELQRPVPPTPEMLYYNGIH